MSLTSGTETTQWRNDIQQTKDTEGETNIPYLDMTAASNGDAGPTSDEPKKKRGADRQITKDDGEDGEDGADGAPPTGTFQKADAATLAKRKIFKVKRPSTTVAATSVATTTTAAATMQDNQQHDTDTKKSNPFATALSGFGGAMTSTTGFAGFGTAAVGGTAGSATTTTGFGFASSSSTSGAMSLGGFGSFGGASKLGDTTFGFPSVHPSPATTTAPTGTTVGSAFGSAKNSIFGAGDTPKFGFASTVLSANSSTAGAGDAEASVLLPVDVEVTNGEEGEELLFEMRSKSFQLVTAEDDSEEEGETPSAQETLQPASMSVPPSSSTAPTTGASTSTFVMVPQDEKQDPVSTKASTMGEQHQQQPSSGAHVSSEEDAASKSMEPPNDTITNNTQPQQQRQQHRWSELGKGPLRVLQNKETRKARIVQRRENAAGGQGTKLLLNTVLNKDSKLTRPSDKHVQLVTVGTSNGAAISYLFKLRNPGDAKQLEGVLQQVIQDDNKKGLWGCERDSTRDEQQGKEVETMWQPIETWFLTVIWQIIPFIKVSHCRS